MYEQTRSDVQYNTNTHKPTVAVRKIKYMHGVHRYASAMYRVYCLHVKHPSGTHASQG